MKSVFRYGILLALIALLGLTPALSVSAQGGTSVCPPGLPADDCKLLEEANANMGKLTSFKMDSWSFTVKTEGLTDGDVDINVKGDGAIDISKITVDPNDPTAALNGLVLLLTLQASVTVPDSPQQSGELELRITDGNVYLKGTPATQGKWQKLPVEQLVGGLGGAFEAALSGQANAATADPRLMEAAARLMAAPGLVTSDAKDGPTVGGQATREIGVNLNLEVLIKTLVSKEFREDFKAIIAAAGQGTTVDDATLTQLESFVPLLEPTLKATKIRFAQLVGKDDKLFHGASFIFTTEVDRTLGSLLGLTDSLKAELTFDVTISAIGEPVTVEVPTVE